MQQLARYVQIELTTICNFDCYYCAGRDMKQQHMSDEVFQRILARLPKGSGITVSLQGEGEPTLHPKFWDWVDAVRARGLHAYTITNGSRVDVAQFKDKLASTGISIDTADPEEAERIGRYNLPKVLRHLEELLGAMGPDRVIVHTVDYGQPLQSLFDHLKGLGVTRHMVQPLQVKDDYARRYGGQVGAPPVVPAQSVVSLYRCGFLEAPRMRFFNINGVEMPCCFIKDSTVYHSEDDLRATLARRQIPLACAGCRELR